MAWNDRVSLGLYIFVGAYFIYFALFITGFFLAPHWSDGMCNFLNYILQPIMAEWCYTTRLQHKNNICSTYCMFRSIWLFGFGIYNRLHVCVTAIVLVYIMYVVCSFLVCMHFRHLQTQLVVWICFRFAHSPIDLLPVKNRPAFENRTWRLPHLWVLPSGLWRERREVDRRRGGGLTHPWSHLGV